MAENQIPFEATLNDDGLMVGIEDIAQALKGLDEISANLGQVMSEAMSRAQESITGLSESADLASKALSPLADLLNRDANAAQESSASLNDLDGAMRAVASAVGVIDSDLLDVVSGLNDLRGSTESVAAGLDQLVAQTERVGEAMAAMAERSAASGAELNTLGARAKEAGGNTNVLADSVGSFLVTMAGFTVINDAFQGLKEFGDAAIYGNSMIERLQATLEALTGSKGAAQKIVDWSYAFGRSIPDTTTNLQQAIVTIASLGINVQDFMPTLATLAGVMGQTLPIAAQAFLDAFESDRFFMMQRRLRVTKEELEQFGLQVDKNGKIIQSTLVPAFEKLVATKFPQGLSEIMGTLSGQVSNMIDQLQQLGMAFGKPIFEVFKEILFGIITFLNQNHDAVWGFATAVGAVLGGALQSVTPLLGDLVQFLQHNHQWLVAIGAVLLGLATGAIAVMIDALIGLLGGFTGLFAIASVVGAVFSGVIGAFVALYLSSEPLRQSLDNLWQSVKKLAEAVGSILLGAVHDLLDPIKTLTGHFSDLFGHFEHAEGPIQQFGRAAHGAADGAHKVAGGLKDLGDQLIYVRGPLSPILDGVNHLADFIGRFADAIKKGDFSGFTNILSQIAPIFLAIGPAILGGMGAFAVFGANAKSLGQFLTSLRNIFQLVGTFVEQLFFKFIDLTDAIPTLSGFVGMLVDGFNAVAVAILNGSVWTMLTGAISTAAGAIGGFLAAIAPVVAVVAIVAAAVIGVVLAFQHWWATSEGFRNAIFGMLGLIASLGKTLMDSLKPAWQQVQESIKQLQPVWEQLVKAFNQMKPLLEFIGAIIIGVLIVAFGILFAVIKGVFQALGPLLAGIIQIFTGIVQVLGGVLSFIITLIAGVFNIIKDIFQGNGDAIAKDWDNLWHGLLDALGTIGSGLVNMVVGLFKGLGLALWGLVSGIVTGIIDWFSMLFDKLVGHSIITDGIALIITVFSRLPGEILQIIANLANWVIARISFMIQMFITIMNTMVSAGRTIMGDVVNAIAGIITSLPGKMAGWATDAINGFANAFRNGIKIIGGIASNIAGAIHNVLHFSLPDEGPLADADQYMPDFVNLLSDGISGNKAKLSKAAADAANDMKQHLSSALNDTTIATQVVNRTGEGAKSATLANAALVKDNGKGGDSHVTVNMHLPDSFAAGFALLDVESRRNLAQQLRDALAEEMARETDRQMLVPTGYAGYSRGG